MVESNKLQEVKKLLLQSQGFEITQNSNLNNIMYYIATPYMIKNLSFFEVCKIADINNWRNHLCHGTCCCEGLTNAFFVLIYKKLIEEKLHFNSQFITDDKICYLGRDKLISKNEAILLQNQVLKTDLKKFFFEINLYNAFKYIGVILYLINHQVENNVVLEKENKKITRFLIDGVKKIFKIPNDRTDSLDTILYGGSNNFLDWGNLNEVYSCLND